MSQTLAMRAQYKFLERRPDGVQIYEHLPDEIGGGGFLPQPIKCDHLDRDDDGGISISYTHKLSVARAYDLHFGQRITKANQIKIEKALRDNKKSLAEENTDITVSIFLAAAFFVASIPLGIKSETATQNAMKDPVVIQRAEERAWDSAINKTDRDTSEKIKQLKSGEKLSITIGDEATLKLRDQFREESLKAEAENTHGWNEADTIIGMIFPIGAGLFGLASLKNLFQIARQNKRLHQLGRDNKRTRKHIATAIGRLPTLDNDE